MRKREERERKRVSTWEQDGGRRGEDSKKLRKRKRERERERERETESNWLIQKRKIGKGDKGT